MPKKLAAGSEGGFLTVRNIVVGAAKRGEKLKKEVCPKRILGNGQEKGAKRKEAKQKTRRNKAKGRSKKRSSPIKNNILRSAKKKPRNGPSG